MTCGPAGNANAHAARDCRRGGASMFQRELLYAAGGAGCTWLAAALGGAGRPAGPQGMRPGRRTG